MRKDVVENDFSIPRQILSTNQNKNLSADWSVRNVRGKTINKINLP